MSGHKESPPTPVEAHHLKKNHYVMMKGRPCKIVKIATSKTGKHGHAKMTFEGVDIFTGSKYSDVQPGHANMSEPHPSKYTYALMDIDTEDSQLSVMNLDTNEEWMVDFDAKRDDEAKLISEIQEQFDNGEMLTITTVCAAVETNQADVYTYPEKVIAWAIDREGDDA